MRTFRIALGQINPTVGDLEGNAHKIVEYTDRARSLGADVVAFPELAITGYPPEDLVLKPQFVQDNIKIMREVASSSKGIGLIVGFVDVEENDIFNAAAVAYDGNLVGIYHKIFLPNYGVFDEDRYFKPGKVCPVYGINGTGVGVNICEDIWYAVGPTVVQRGAGAEVIININGSPYHAGKRAFREQMVGARASDNGLNVAYVNTVGGQDELVFDGGSMVFNQNGELVAQGRQFVEELLVADVDVEAVFRSRMHDPRRRKERVAIIEGVGAPQKIKVSGYVQRPKPPIIQAVAPLLDPVEEVYGALVLGTRDYVHKTGFKKVVIALSGGIDSTITACIAVDALGKENVIGVSMPSRYSSEGSIVDARALTQNLGIEMRMLPIEDAFSAYLSTLSESFKGLAPNVAEENIQARIRGNLLMALSNKFGWLVLTTGNKSEYATGYCTLYGDMAGGFAVIKDVPKTLVYKLSEWRNGHGTPPNPIPRAVLTKPPSAELKMDQTDQDTLPPYSVLDGILKAYVEEDRTYQEILALGFDEATVKRTIQMVDRSEYKRRQSPPGIKITPRAFGRDRRMPIVNRYPHF